MVKKGIVLYMKRGEGKILLHEETLREYMAQLPKDEKGWSALEVTFNLEPNARTSHNVRPADARQRKITGPTNFKTAG